MAEPPFFLIQHRFVYRIVGSIGVPSDLLGIRSNDGCVEAEIISPRGQFVDDADLGIGIQPIQIFGIDLHAICRHVVGSREDLPRQRPVPVSDDLDLLKSRSPERFRQRSAG